MLFSSFARRAASALHTNKRMMSGHGAEDAASECVRWYKITVVMIGISSLMAVYNIVAHDHDHARHGLPYQKIRNKPYPWKCSDCNLFDNDCFAECKGAKKAKASGH